MKRIILLLTICSIAACSSESGSAGSNNGWELGDDAGNNASDANSVNNATTPGSTNNNTTTSPNNTTPVPPNNTSGPTTTGSNNTTGSSNNTNGTNSMTTGNGTGVEGDPCMVNSACGADLVCCPGFGGDPTCQPRCFGGGLCGGNDAECSGNDVCCDLSGINQPDSCISPNNCRGGNGNGGTPCQNNNECQDPEVCCLGFDGQGECTTDCFSGGACEVDMDCRNGQLCCDISVAKVCFDRCNF